MINNNKTTSSSNSDLLSILDDFDDQADDKKIEEIQIPVQQEQLISVSDLLPTGRQHISYSELHDWIDCQWRHKLKYIDKITLDTESIHTLYGQHIHSAVESYVVQPKEDRKPIDTKRFVDEWHNKQIPEFLERMKAAGNDKRIKEYTDNKKEFDESFEMIFEVIPSWLDETFPDWTIHGAELKLYESVERFNNRFFKGFIDCVIKVPKKKKPEEFDYHILDWKSTSWGWSFDKKTAFTKQMQLVLYKHFFARLQSVPMKDIKCAFVLLKRKPPKANPKAHCELVSVSVGPVTESKALEYVERMFMHLKKGLYNKNRSSCTYCNYKNTEHCP